MSPKVKESVARLIEQADSPLPEFRDAITDELCALTQSELSYFAAVTPAEDTLTMIGWSRSAMGFCAISDKPIVYDVTETGLWGDAIRERGPVITNDYPALMKATKKGYPQGHVQVRRHMNLPIFEGNKIVLVVGVGNKATEYTMQDAQNVEDMMSQIWTIFKRILWNATW